MNGKTLNVLMIGYVTWLCMMTIVVQNMSCKFHKKILLLLYTQQWTLGKNPLCAHKRQAKLV